MDTAVPSYLYKYLSLSRKYPEFIFNDGKRRKKNGFDVLEDILLHNKIHYSKPSYFNDPFELEGVRMRFSRKEKERLTNKLVLRMRKEHPPDVSRSKVSKLIRESAEKNFDEIEEVQDKDEKDFLHRVGFVSLSSTNKEKLMWTHYADKHRGICLRLKGKKDSFYEANGAGRVTQVTYDDEILEKEYGEDVNSEGFLLQTSRKADCWAYEEEFRVYRPPSTPEADDAHGNHDFNSALVNGVYFGLRTADEDKERIKNIVALASHKVSIFQAVRHPSRLEIVFEALED